ncbi:MAG: PAS domain-containing protein [Deltaproteobacteria bacterium]|nr:PAS domain-containing protein [Deltaproteobacteria bacterium]
MTENALRDVARYLGADRAFVLEAAGADDYFHIVQQWCGHGVSAVPNALVGWRGPGEPLADLTSILSLPVAVDGRSWGYLVFGRRGAYESWSEDARKLATTVSIILTSALERRQAETALRRNEARLSLAVDAARAGIYEQDWPLDGPVRYSERLSEMLGLPSRGSMRPEEAVTWWREHLHEEDRDPTLHHVLEFVGGRVEYFEKSFRVRHDDGGWIHLTVHAKATGRRKDGSAAGLIALALDTTAMHGVREAMRRRGGGIPGDARRDRRRRYGHRSGIRNDLCQPGCPGSHGPWRR